MSQTLQAGLSEFCRGLLAALVERGDRHLTIGDPKIERALPGILRILWEEADKQYESEDRDATYQLMRIIEGLSPDPNTGVFDGFWSTVNQLQPFVVTIANPMFKEIELNLSKDTATESLSSLPPVLREVSRRSADLISGSQHAA